MRLGIRAAFVFGVAFVAGTTSVGAQSYTGHFGGAGYSEYTWFGPKPDTSGFSFRHGEYYQQVFTNTGLSSAQSLSLTLNILQNPYGGSQLFTAFLNGTGVGTYTISNQSGLTNFAFFFSPVAATGSSDFTLLLQQTGPTVFSGGGSSAFEFSKSSAVLTQSVTTTPEPSSMALLGTGLVGLVPVLRRKRRK